jgi:carboxypeptidase C (cathepsin A)
MRKSVVLPLVAAIALPICAQRGDLNRRPRETPSGSNPAAAAQTNPPPANPPAHVEEKISKTQHSLQIGGQTIHYTAVAGTMVLEKEDRTPSASIFYVAYTKDDVPDESKRPLTFAFNGGPGSSSVWLQMGGLGPKRVLMGPDGNATPPPYHFVDNEYSMLDTTDLVFIDPVSTGYSRAIPDAGAKDFHGFTTDVQSVGEFIRLYTSRNDRWTSPKFLVGESYGTTRAGALSGYLQEKLGMNLNGIILLSSVLNFGAINFDPGNDLPYILFLPSYTAAAWYHHKLPKDLEAAGLKKAIEESARFAEGSYALALLKGDSIPAEERNAVVKNLARLTGLSPAFLEENRLRVTESRFRGELLREENRTIGRYDGRITGINSGPPEERAEFDPSYASVQGPFTAAWNEYVRADLKFESDLPYEVLTSKVQPWSFQEFQNRYVNVTNTLAEAMAHNPDLKVFVGCGYYDLATPFLSAQYTFDHMQLDPAVRSHISTGYYEAGHMMYTHLKSLQQAKQDLVKFLVSCLPGA